jgi:hypothetical protein
LSVEVLPECKAAHVVMPFGAKTPRIGFLGGAIGGQCVIELRQLDIEVVAVSTRVPADFYERGLDRTALD